jgi:hypothetical protein
VRYVGNNVAEIYDHNDETFATRAVKINGMALINGRRLTETTFEWRSGAAMPYRDYYPMEPNNGTGYSCLAFQVGGGWRDASCTARHNSVLFMNTVNYRFAGYTTRPVAEPVTPPQYPTNDTSAFTLQFTVGANSPRTRTSSATRHPVRRKLASLDMPMSGSTTLRLSRTFSA